ncbi:MAG TPA: acyl-CoA dehydrogenase family protein [Actinomycetota bacterium]|nr:acyl-CoA dehydrogenase family protein [Actinomycetota bacterium]
MEFGLTEEQRDLQKWAHEFAEKEIRPVAPYYDETEEFPWEVLKKAAQVGLYSLDVYYQAAGDTSGLTLPLIMEELYWGCAGIALAISGTGLPLMALWSGGTPDQLQTWAPRMIGTPDDPQIAAFAVTEPQSGSDVSSLRTRARREGDEWVISGRKVFITNGGLADIHIVVATVDPELGHRGQASFIVPRDTPGFAQGKKEKKLGIRASHTAELLLDDVRIPVDNILGGIDKFEARLARARSGQSSGRASSALRTFEVTRPLVGISAVGIARAAFEFALDYAKQRTQFGKRIIEHESVGNILADMATEIDAARLLAYRAAWMGASGAPYVHAEGSMSKLKAAEVAVRVTERAVQVLGGYGYIRDFPVEKWYRDAKIYTIFEGTSEIQRLVIARALAGD